MFRTDRNCFGGGLYTYVKEKIASKQLNLDLDKENEAIWNIPSRKCLIVIYTSPPSQNKSFLLENMSKSLSRYLKSYKNITLLGNFNVNPKDENLQHFTYTFSLSHLINKPTCFKGSPSCIHLIITDRKSTSKIHCTKNEVFYQGFLQ